MDSRSETVELRDKATGAPAGTLEIGTVVHNGREYAAQGAMITDDRLVAYLQGDYDNRDARGIPQYRTMAGGTVYEPRTGDVTTWNGQIIGRYYVTGRAHGWHGTRLVTVRIFLTDGRQFVGKGQGSGMIIKARRARTTEPGTVPKP